MENGEFSSRLKDFELLEAYINTKVEVRVKELAKDYYESEKTDQICAALAKAQGEFQTIVSNRTNNYLFRQYSDLDIIMKTIRAALSNNGLSITFQQKIEDEKTILVTRLRHESSQFFETRVRIIPSKNDIQTYASNLKAMKRHSLMAILNITIQDDIDDDDGEYDMKTVRIDRTKGTGINTRYAAKKESFEPISQHEADELQYLLANYPDIAEQVLETLKIDAIADIPKSKFGSVRDQAKEIINTREGRGKKF